MKFVTLFFILVCTSVSAQFNSECFIADESSPLTPQDYVNLKSIKGVSDFDPVTFNIYFWGFKRADNSGNVAFTQENIETAVGWLNALYSQCNITFVLMGYESIPSEKYYTISSPTLFYDMLLDMHSSGFVNNQAFNVYVSNEYQGFGGAAEGFHTTSIGIPSVQLINPGTFEHEMGHCFSLRHTNVDGNSLSCESAVRDPSDLLFNADITGDFVADTAACYGFDPSEVDLQTCTLISNKSDCYGYPYQVPASLLHNYLTTGASSCEKDRLTPGQFVRIRKSVELDPYGLFQAATVD